eukprot:2726257-Pyramimonas_sp.AAC.1
MCGDKHPSQRSDPCGVSSTYNRGAKPSTRLPLLRPLTSSSVRSKPKHAFFLPNLAQTRRLAQRAASGRCGPRAP